MPELPRLTRAQLELKRELFAILLDMATGCWCEQRWQRWRVRADECRELVLEAWRYMNHFARTDRTRRQNIDSALAVLNGLELAIRDHDHCAHLHAGPAIDEALHRAVRCQADERWLDEVY